jgi:hypothetical protein
VTGFWISSATNIKFVNFSIRCTVISEWVLDFGRNEQNVVILNHAITIASDATNLYQLKKVKFISGDLGLSNYRFPRPGPQPNQWLSVVSYQLSSLKPPTV